MCGRFCLASEPQEIYQHFSLINSVPLKPRYNIAPGQVVPVIRKPGILDFLTWGLRPRWLKNDQQPFTNARMETLAQKPAFKNAFKQQRCLVLANGYYEWKKIGNRKQAYFISLAEQRVFAFAALWENDGCVVITRAAQTEDLLAIHEREPLILREQDYALWLDPKIKVDALELVMHQREQQKLIVRPVSSKVNNPKEDSVECILALQ